MRLTLEGTDQRERSARETSPRVSVELPHDDLTVDEVLECLVCPALLAAGYAESNVAVALGMRGAVDADADADDV